MYLMSRVVEALGLKELGEEISHDTELVVCRAQQLAKMEGEKIVDKVCCDYNVTRLFEQVISPLIKNIHK